MSVSVRVPLKVMAPGGQGALAYLTALPPKRVAKLYKNVIKHRQRIRYQFGTSQYSRIRPRSGRHDAIDIILRKLFCPGRSVELCLGHPLRSRPGCLPPVLGT